MTLHLPALALLAALAPARAPAPTIAYTLHLNAAHLDVADIEMRISGAPASFQIAMKVHGEYDARYWRFIDGMQVDGTQGRISRVDSTLWQVNLRDGHGVIRYRVHIQPPSPDLRRAWMPYARADGAFINSPDFFLYSPQLAAAPSTVDLDVPRDWRIATSLPANGAPTHLTARDAVTLLDSPILLGALREWQFTESGTRYHVVYWPLPNAAPFDTIALVDALHGMARAATGVFGSNPAREYFFLLQDGAGDALEHLGSVTLGVPSAGLARDPRGYSKLTTIAHEFTHTWNLVAIHPAGYNELSFRAPARTPGLWIGEGITLHYSDVLPRRAGLIDTSASRLAHLRSLIQRYYGSPATVRVSPERASLAFGDSPRNNPDAAASYYLQGEILGNVIDAMVRDSTQDRRGLDDVMRALYARSMAPGYRGFTSHDFEATVDSICACRMDALFTNVIRGSKPIDATPVVTRLGLQLILDSTIVVDSAGHPLADVRLSIDFGDTSGALTLVLTNPATPWAHAGLHTGDEVTAVNGTTVHAWADLQRILPTLRIGDEVPVDIRRNGEAVRLAVTMTGYSLPRVRFVDAANVTIMQRTRREAWSSGH